tara:strand:+ start:2686 stop:3144 length:459 start_codon:yes stop_codon:yes gene_type:complete
MATSDALISANALCGAMKALQGDDPSSVTLPNACLHSLVNYGKTDQHTRCFSIALKNAQLLPPDKWELMVFPEEMPAPKELPDGVVVHSQNVLVDHITCGLMDKHQLQGMLGANNELMAIRMFPPPTVEDASKYWDTFSNDLLEARKRFDAK